MLISLVVLYSFFEFVSLKPAHAQTSVPVIRSLDPQPPHCVLRESDKASDRLLTITGENLVLYEEKALQFLDVSSGRESTSFKREVDWRDPRRIMVDMALVEQRLRSGAQVRLRVRIVSSQSPGLASAWSYEFTLARESSSCGTPSPFPPTSPIRGLAGDLWADVVIGEKDFSQAGESSVVPFKVFNPGGVVVDRSVYPGRAYVWDSANSRILGIDLANSYDGISPCSADVVIGQPS